MQVTLSICLHHVQKLWHKQFHVLLDNNEADSNDIVCQIFANICQKYNKAVQKISKMRSSQSDRAF